MVSSKRFLFVGLLIAMGTAAFAQTPPQMAPGPARPREFMRPTPVAMPICPTQAICQPMQVDEILREVPEITPQQAQKIDALRKGFVDKMNGAASQTQSKTWALMQAMTTETADPAKSKELALAAGKAEADALATVVAFWNDLRAVLTPAQGLKLVESLQRRMAPGLRPGMSGRGFGDPGY